MKMNRVILALAALAVAIVAAPSGFAAKPPKPPKPPKLTTVKLLAFNDFHGHLEAGTPGTIVESRERAPRSPAGGAEYFATHMKALGSDNADTYVVSAGDLIGASPLLSGLMHDEPTIDFMNYVGLDTIGVGNHEFDEGKGELLRMQYGNRTHAAGDANTGSAYVPARADGCHPVDGCQDGTPFSGSVFQYLAANVIDTDTNNPLLPQYQIVTNSEGAKVAFVGETLQGTPLIVTPTGVAGLSFLDEADTVNALVSRLKQRNVSTIVLLLHEGGIQNAPFSRGFMDVNKCENFTGPGPARHRQPARPGRRRRRQRPHAPAVHLQLEQPARDARVVVRPPDHLDRHHDRPQHGHDGLGDGHEQRRHADGRKDPGDRDPAPATRRSPTRSATA